MLVKLVISGLFMFHNVFERPGFPEFTGPPVVKREENGRWEIGFEMLHFPPLTETLS